MDPVVGFDFASDSDSDIEFQVQVPVRNEEEGRRRYEYNNQDYLNMLRLYYENNQVAHAAAAQYRLDYPVRGRPDANVILNVERRLREHGQLMPIYNNAGRPRTVRNGVTEDLILNHFGADGRNSTRKAEQQFGISKSTVHRILKEDRQHPYHYRRVQELLEPDYERRMAFCRLYLHEIAADPSFAARILWTDECNFTRDGMFNTHNYHCWAHNNPFLTWESKSQTRWSVNVWAGLIDDQVIGPFFLPPRLNGQGYLDFLQNSLPGLLFPPEIEIEDVPLARRNFILQQDGAPAHYAHIVRNYLNEQLPGRWIGRGGPVAWPPRSPDLTPLDFFLWGAVKEVVYRQRITNQEDLINRIRQAFLDLTPDVIRRATIESVERRARLCLERNGRHFEHIL